MVGGGDEGRVDALIGGRLYGRSEFVKLGASRLRIDHHQREPFVLDEETQDATNGNSCAKLHVPPVGVIEEALRGLLSGPVRRRDARPESVPACDEKRLENPMPAKALAFARNILPDALVKRHQLIDVECCTHNGSATAKRRHPCRTVAPTVKTTGTQVTSTDDGR